MQNSKILVLGYGQHGKDTACGILSSKLGYRFKSTSLFCAERVMLPYFRTHLNVNYVDAQDCHYHRHDGNNRAVWFNAIIEYNYGDPARLARELLEHYDVYCGMRCKKELAAVKREKLFDHIIWIDRSKLRPPENADSCTVTPEMADAIIDNNSTYKNLTRNLTEWHNARH